MYLRYPDRCEEAGELTGEAIDDGLPAVAPGRATTEAVGETLEMYLGAVEALRAWARATLRHDLADGGREVLGPEDGEALCALQTRPATGTEGDARGVFATLVRFTDVDPELTPVQAAACGRLSELRRGSRWRRRAFAPDSLHYPRTELWDLLGACAWSDPAFEYETSALVRNVLRERHLFRIGELPVVHLHPNTLWFALLAVPDESEPRGRWRRRIHRLRRWWRPPPQAALGPLMEAASRLCRRTGWAGFWDQWLPAEIADRRDTRRLASACGEIVRELPILRVPGSEHEPSEPARSEAGAEGEEADATPEPTSVARPGWLDEAPSWMGDHFVGLRARTARSPLVRSE